ncbi:MAG: hypothetical protein M0Z61_00200 [Nitrospiraceae bacterium]|nr:hypothetical protein [Nitrospiraceae bacterium]
MAVTIMGKEKLCALQSRNDEGRDTAAKDGQSPFSAIRRRASFAQMLKKLFFRAVMSNFAQGLPLRSFDALDLKDIKILNLQREEINGIIHSTYAHYSKKICAVACGNYGCCAKNYDRRTITDYILRLGSDRPIGSYTHKLHIIHPQIIRKLFPFITAKNSEAIGEGCCPNMTPEGCADLPEHRTRTCITYLCNSIFDQMTQDERGLYSAAIERLDNLHARLALKLLCVLPKLLWRKWR